MNDHIDLTFNIDQVEKGNEINIVNTIDLHPDSTVIKFQPSKLIVLKNQWRFSPDNRIDIKGKELSFSNVHLSNKDQFV